MPGQRLPGHFPLPLDSQTSLFDAYIANAYVSSHEHDPAAAPDQEDDGHPFGRAESPAEGHRRQPRIKPRRSSLLLSASPERLSSEGSECGNKRNSFLDLSDDDDNDDDGQSVTGTPTQCKSARTRKRASTSSTLSSMLLRAAQLVSDSPGTIVEADDDEGPSLVPVPSMPPTPSRDLIQTRSSPALRHRSFTTSSSSGSSTSSSSAEEQSPLFPPPRSPASSFGESLPASPSPFSSHAHGNTKLLIGTTRFPPPPSSSFARAPKRESFDWPLSSTCTSLSSLATTTVISTGSTGTHVDFGRVGEDGRLRASLESRRISVAPWEEEEEEAEEEVLEDLAAQREWQAAARRAASGSFEQEEGRSSGATPRSSVESDASGTTEYFDSFSSPSPSFDLVRPPLPPKTIKKPEQLVVLLTEPTPLPAQDKEQEGQEYFERIRISREDTSLSLWAEQTRREVGVDGGGLERPKTRTPEEPVVSRRATTPEPFIPLTASALKSSSLSSPTFNPAEWRAPSPRPALRPSPPLTLDHLRPSFSPPLPPHLASTPTGRQHPTAHVFPSRIAARPAVTAAAVPPRPQIPRNDTDLSVTSTVPAVVFKTEDPRGPVTNTAPFAAKGAGGGGLGRRLIVGLGIGVGKGAPSPTGGAKGREPVGSAMVGSAMAEGMKGRRKSANGLVLAVVPQSSSPTQQRRKRSSSSSKGGVRKAKSATALTPRKYEAREDEVRAFEGLLKRAEREEKERLEETVRRRRASMMLPPPSPVASEGERGMRV